MIGYQEALVYCMVMTSAADRDMTDAELRRIGDIVRQLPAFRGLDDSELPGIARACAARLEPEDGMAALLDDIRAALPKPLRETAYALACEIAVADDRASQEELRFLELMRHRLEVGRLPAAAIERGVAARYAHLPDAPSV